MADQRPLKPGNLIGIVGGGQLARMLAMAAAKLGYCTAVLDPDALCPAGQVSGSLITATYDDHAALEKLAKICAVVTYEFENVPDHAMTLLSEQVAVAPSPHALAVSRDRMREKAFFNHAGIATVNYRAVDGPADLESALQSAAPAAFLKTRFLGYDGKGQVAITATKDPDPGTVNACRLLLANQPCILEEACDFACEISIIAARGHDGVKRAFDPSLNTHRGGVLSCLVVPCGIDADLCDRAREIAFTILDQLEYIGVIGVEFFVGRDGQLLVNEIAPRVHNSGHWTEAACTISQFEQHVRAICGLALGDTNRHSDCEMHNLLGDEIDRIAQLTTEPDLLIHHYGKKDPRPGRKMGHYTRLFPLKPH